MQKPGMTSIALGIGLFVLIIVVYPFAKPAIQSAAATILAITPGAGAFETLIIDTMPYWGLAAAFIVAAIILVKGAK